MKTDKQPALMVCILMDLAGSASYLLPGIGEFTDIIWAPISAIIFYRMFGGWKGAFGGVFSFVEEIVPGIDFIPTFTIAWIWKYFNSRQPKSAFIQSIQG